jgi:hypothetical protein
MVSEEDFKLLLDFPYLESQQAIDDFSAWVDKLGVSKIKCKSSGYVEHSLTEHSLVEAQDRQLMDCLMHDQRSFEAT